MPNSTAPLQSGDGPHSLMQNGYASAELHEKYILGASVVIRFPDLMAPAVSGEKDREEVIFEARIYLQAALDAPS